MADTTRDRVIVGANGHVVALDPTSGREIWRTKLRGRSFVSTNLVGERVVAATGGYLYSLDPVTGAILWENALKGLGFGLVSLGANPALEAAALQAQRQRQAAAS